MANLEGMQKRVRSQLRGGETAIVLAAAEAQTLLDELGRLQQSSDRLRRQNRRLRLRLQGAGIDDGPETEAPETPEEP